MSGGSNEVSDELSDAQSDAVSSDVIQFFTTIIGIKNEDYMKNLLERLKLCNILSMDSLNSISNDGIKNLELKVIPYQKLMITHGENKLEIGNNIRDLWIKGFFKCNHVMCPVYFIAMCKSGSNILCSECKAS